MLRTASRLIALIYCVIDKNSGSNHTEAYRRSNTKPDRCTQKRCLSHTSKRPRASYQRIKTGQGGGLG